MATEAPSEPLTKLEHNRSTDEPDVLWNFEKFLVGRDGSVIGRFAPNMTPEDAVLVSAIEAALG